MKGDKRSSRTQILYACLCVFLTLLAVGIFLVSEWDSTDWPLGFWPSLSMVHLYGV